MSTIQRKEILEVLVRMPLHRLKRIIFLESMDSLRVCLSVAALTWSALLYWPGDTFNRPTYDLMNYVAGELWWATAFLLQGVVMLLALLYDYRDRFVVLFDCVMGCVLWSACTVMMLLSVYPPPAAISAEIIMAFASWWVLVRFLADEVE